MFVFYFYCMSVLMMAKILFRGSNNLIVIYSSGCIVLFNNDRLSSNSLAAHFQRIFHKRENYFFNKKSKLGKTKGYTESVYDRTDLNCDSVATLKR